MNVPGQPHLSVEYRATHDGHVWLASVVLLVDGEDPFASIGSGGYIGLAPDDLASQPALLEPSGKPSQVRLYRCSCGESGCSSVVARCYQLRDEVVWDLFDSGNPPPVNLDAPQPADDALVFSAEDYERFTAHVRQLASRYPGWH